MPSYEYKYTDEKGGDFQLSHSIKDPALCEHDGRPCKRQISRPQVIFRGEGWGGHIDGSDRLRKIYEKNVEQAEPARELARSRGWGSEDNPAEAVSVSEDNESPDAAG